jgi:hypothetical protein
MYDEDHRNDESPVELSGFHRSDDPRRSPRPSAAVRESLFFFLICRSSCESFSLISPISL